MNQVQIYEPKLEVVFLDKEDIYLSATIFKQILKLILIKMSN